MDSILEQLRQLTAGRIDHCDTGKKIAELIRAAHGYHWVGLYDVTATEMVIFAWTGDSSPAFPKFPVTRGLNGAAVALREDLVVQDVRNDPRYLTTFGSTRSEAIFLVRGAPDGRLIGTIDVESDRPNAFRPEDTIFLRQCVEAITCLWTG
jgi:GAF domain-containing protein